MRRRGLAKKRKKKKKNRGKTVVTFERTKEEKFCFASLFTRLHWKSEEGARDNQEGQKKQVGYINLDSRFTEGRNRPTVLLGLLSLILEKLGLRALKLFPRTKLLSSS